MKLESLSNQTNPYGRVGQTPQQAEELQRKKREEDERRLAADPAKIQKAENKISPKDPSPGAYKVYQEGGQPVVQYSPYEKEPGREKAEDPVKEGPTITKCKVDTSRVDQELKQLAQRKQDLARQLQQADQDPERKAALAQQLAQVESELQRKGTDAYRKQGASMSFQTV